VTVDVMGRLNITRADIVNEYFIQFQPLEGYREVGDAEEPMRAGQNVTKEEWEKILKKNNMNKSIPNHYLNVSLNHPSDISQ